MAQEISREELGEKLDRGDGIVLVDVLGEPYYRHSHLPGAISLPLEERGLRRRYRTKTPTSSSTARAR